MPGMSAMLHDCDWGFASVVFVDLCCLHISCAKTLALRAKREKINIANSADFFIATVGLLSLSDACKCGHTPCALAGTIIDDRLFLEENQIRNGIKLGGLENTVDKYTEPFSLRDE